MNAHILHRPRQRIRIAILLSLALVPLLSAPLRAETPIIGTELGLHVVEAGDSLFRLAGRYGMTVSDLVQLNAMATTDVLIPGEGLWIPLDRAVNARAGAPALVAAAGAALAATSADGTRHIVQPGETLYAISRRYGAAVEDLKRWNGLPPDGSIQAGASLIVGDAADASGRSADPAGGAPKSGRSGAGEGSPDSGSGAVEGPRTSGGQTSFAYVVEPGDTLTSIAERFDETANGLQRLNGLADDGIQVGQRLLVPAAGSGPNSVTVGQRRVEIDVSEQRMYVWQGQTLVWNFVISTGLPGYPTRRGSFAVQSKIPNAWSNAWQLWMPYWMGIYWAGPSENGIHALPIVNGQRLWGGYLGSPISYGCIVMASQDAEQLYNWVEIGTPVNIQD
jgi:LysM repeat protein